MRRNANLIFRGSGLAFVVFLAWSSQTMAQYGPDASTTQQNRWNTVYQAGAAPFGVGSRIHVTITEGKVTFEGNKGASFSIPTSNITAVSANLTSEHTAMRTQAAAWGGLVQFSPYTLLFLPFGVPVMAATYPIKSKYAYFSILWSEEATDEELQFRLDRKDYEPFVTELRKSTGKEWKNVESEWKRLKQALASGAGQQTTVRLNRKVRVGKVDVRPGLYELVVLPGSSSQGEAYLFSNHDVNVEHLISSGQVEIANSATVSQEAEVSFKQDDHGITRISEIHLAGQLLRFP